MTPDLKTFLTDWLAWTERGAPEGDPYTRRYGLCHNAKVFDSRTRVSMWGLLDTQFDEDAATFPFGEDAYRAARTAKTQHLDPNRLAWVRAQL